MSGMSWRSPNVWSLVRRTAAYNSIAGEGRNAKQKAIIGGSIFGDDPLVGRTRYFDLTYVKAESVFSLFHAVANRNWRCDNEESLSDATGCYTAMIVGANVRAPT
jgi:hypothetical protein